MTLKELVVQANKALNQINGSHAFVGLTHLEDEKEIQEELVRLSSSSGNYVEILAKMLVLVNNKERIQREPQQVRSELDALAQRFQTTYSKSPGIISYLNPLAYLSSPLSEYESFLTLLQNEIPAPEAKQAPAGMNKAGNNFFQSGSPNSAAVIRLVDLAVAVYGKQSGGTSQDNLLNIKKANVDDTYQLLQYLKNSRATAKSAKSKVTEKMLHIFVQLAKVMYAFDEKKIDIALKVTERALEKIDSIAAEQKKLIEGSKGTWVGRSYQDEFETLYGQFVSAVKEEITRIKNELLKEKQRLISLESENKRLAKELSEAENGWLDLRGRLESLQSENERLTKELAQSKEQKADDVQASIELDENDRRKLIDIVTTEINLRKFFDTARCSNDEVKKVYEKVKDIAQRAFFPSKFQGEQKESSSAVTNDDFQVIERIKKEAQSKTFGVSPMHADSVSAKSLISMCDKLLAVRTTLALVTDLAKRIGKYADKNADILLHEANLAKEMVFMPGSLFVARTLRQGIEGGQPRAGSQPQSLR